MQTIASEASHDDVRPVSVADDIATVVDVQALSEWVETDPAPRVSPW
jgi:hypothetical protein